MAVLPHPLAPDDVAMRSALGISLRCKYGGWLQIIRSGCQMRECDFVPGVNMSCCVLKAKVRSACSYRQLV